VTETIGPLKGPLHGGANEAVLEMMNDIDDPERARQRLAEVLADKRKIEWFGHRVYKHGDSRVSTMRAALVQAENVIGGQRLLALHGNCEDAMIESKDIHPNLDFPTRPAYHLMGFDTPTFTPIIVISRITGWTAHVIEQLGANSLIHPPSSYFDIAGRHLTTR